MQVVRALVCLYSSLLATPTAPCRADNQVTFSSSVSVAQIHWRFGLASTNAFFTSRRGKRVMQVCQMARWFKTWASKLNPSAVIITVLFRGALFHVYPSHCIISYSNFRYFTAIISVKVVVGKLLIPSSCNL